MEANRQMQSVTKLKDNRNQKNHFQKSLQRVNELNI